MKKTVKDRKTDIPGEICWCLCDRVHHVLGKRDEAHYKLNWMQVATRQ